MPFKSKEFSDLPIQLGRLRLALDVEVRLGENSDVATILDDVRFTPNDRTFSG